MTEEEHHFLWIKDMHDGRRGGPWITRKRCEMFERHKLSLQASLIGA